MTSEEVNTIPIISSKLYQYHSRKFGSLSVLEQEAKSLPDPFCVLI